METLEELADRHARHTARAVRSAPAPARRARRRRPRPARWLRCSPPCSSSETGRPSPSSRPVAGCSSPTRTGGPRVATSRSTSKPSPPATTPRRGGEIDRALTCVDAASLAPDADGDDLVDRRAGRLGQAQRRGEQGPPRGRPPLDRDHRQRRGRASRASRAGPLPPDQAQPLAKNALRFLYRILFLLYAEASPELGVLPVRVPEYEQGYSLDRLRELVLVEPATPQARSRHPPLRVAQAAVRARRPGDATTRGLEFNPLRADLFRPQATALIDEVRLGNAALQRVLAALLLTQEGPGQDARLHLLRRTRHQPARRGLRGADVLHRLLRHRGPVRGGQRRQPGEGLLGRPGRPGRRHRREGLRPRGGPRTARRRPVLHPRGTVRLPAVRS